MGGAIERAFPAAPVPGPAGLIASSFQYLLTGTETLRVLTMPLGTGATFTLQSRQYRKATDDTQVSEHQLRGTVVGNTQVSDIPLTAGALLNVRLSLTPASIRTGQVWAEVHLVQGQTGSTKIIGTLMQGYMGGDVALAWPGSAIQSLHDGRGYITADEPAFVAATVYRLTIGNSLRYRVISGTYDVIASAVVADRFAFVRVERAGGIVVFEGAGAGPITAGQTARVSFGAGMTATGVTALLVWHLPFPSDLELDPGDRITIYVGNTQAGDIISAPTFLVRVWLVKT